MVYGLWFMVYGLWFMVYGLWFVVYGLWYMVYGLWFMVYGLWYMVYGIRCTVYEIRCMEMLMVFGKRYVINGECFMADPSAPNSEAHNLKHVHISWSRSETVSKIIAQGFNLVSGAPP